MFNSVNKFLTKNWKYSVMVSTCLISYEIDRNFPYKYLVITILSNFVTIDCIDTLHTKGLYSSCNKKALIWLRMCSGIFTKNFYFFNNNKSFWQIIWHRITATWKNYCWCCHFVKNMIWHDIHQNFRNI